MSFVAPKINPDSYTWLEQQDPEQISEAHFYACAVDYVRHHVEQGIAAEQFQHPDAFFKQGDLQLLSTVVSNWPQDPSCPVRKPTPASLLQSIRSFDTSKRQTFAEALYYAEDRARKWVGDNGGDPDNPNETRKERSNRMAAARMRKMRAKIADTDISDPDEMNLVRALRAAKENLASGRKYVRDQETVAKAAYDAAVAQAKAARSATVSTAQSWLPSAIQAVTDAEQALENYRINK